MSDLAWVGTERVIQYMDAAERYRIYVANGVFVSGGVGEDGRVLPPLLFTALAERLSAETGWRASALWPYGSKQAFGIAAFIALTRRSIGRYAAFLTEAIRFDIAQHPLHERESVALIAYSGAAPIIQTAATLLRPAIPVGAFVFFGPAVRPKMAPRHWAGDAQIGCILGEQDWVQGVYPRVPRPWQRALHPTTDAGIRAALPETTTYRTLPCDHWPGYFTDDAWPLLIQAVCDLLQPATVLG